MTFGLTRVIATNSRELTWKYWVVLAAWETAVVSIATAGVAGGSFSVDGSFVGWALFFLLSPALPLLIPGAVRQRLASGIILSFQVLFVGAILWGLGGYVAVWLAPDRQWAYRWRYSLESDMNGAVFTVNRKPHNCDFLTAPIGVKHCHYEGHIDTIRVRTSAGQHVVSVDEGRTWRRDDGSTRPAVWVSWERVED